MGTKVTTFWGAVGIIIGGLIIADLLGHPAGTQAAGTAVANITTPTEAALIGTAPKATSSTTYPKAA